MSLSQDKRSLNKNTPSFNEIFLVPWGGIEPPTLSLEVSCSVQLSYQGEQKAQRKAYHFSSSLANDCLFGEFCVCF